MSENQWKLPVEINDKFDVDETEGEYKCMRCKGWGYIVEKRMINSKMESFPLRKCPDCRGGGIVDWARRPRQN